MIRVALVSLAVLVITYSAGYFATVSRVREAAWMSPRYSVLPQSIARPLFQPAHAIDRRLRPAFWTVRESQ